MEILTCPESTETSQKTNQLSESKVGHYWSNQIYLEEVKEDQTEAVTLEEEVGPGEESVTEEVWLGEVEHLQTEGGYNLPHRSETRPLDPLARRHWAQLGLVQKET